MTGKVIAVCRGAGNDFRKPSTETITLVAGLGVDGDAHSGKTVQHLYLKAKDPTVPNLRQVHLIQAELFDELRDKGYEIAPGELGENVTTSGVALTDLPTGARLSLGGAEIEITGLRTPCRQIDGFRKGLTKAVTAKTSEGHGHLKFGVMGIVTKTGDVCADDDIRVALPPPPHRVLSPV